MCERYAMIDPSTETLISLIDAARSLPARRRGKRPHVSCAYRWTKTGCRGVILESIQVGGTRCTSKEALARFMEALTYGADRPAVRSPVKRRRAAERAVEALVREGVCPGVLAILASIALRAWNRGALAHDNPI